MNGPTILTPDQAATRIRDGATVALSGSGGGLLEPSELFPAVRNRFDREGAPSGLTLVHSLGIGHPTGRGLETWADSGLIRKVIGGHWAWSPTMQKLAASNEIEAYSLPAGVISLLLQEIGADRPGLFTRTGIGTFVDPRLGGGRCNDMAEEELVQLVEIGGETYLHFLPFAVDVGLIRGSVADPRGNLSCIDEPASLDVLAVAKAARVSGGIVIAQVREVVEPGSINPRLVDVPGSLIDVLVVAPDQWQTYESAYNPSYAGVGTDDAQAAIASSQNSPVERQLVAGRAAREVRRNETVNVGFGMASEVVNVLDSVGMLDEMELYIEQGAIGGIPVPGELFGISRGFEALTRSTDQFDLFAAGVLDRSFLGLAEVDAEGSVNVSMLNDRLIGPGGFIDISQHAKEVVFCGTFRAGGLEVVVEDDALTILEEGAIPKFVESLKHITYSGALARDEGRRAIYVTERCVFSLHEKGLELIEVVEGIDIDRHILQQMEFEPIVDNPRVIPVADYVLHDLAPVAQEKGGSGV